MADTDYTRHCILVLGRSLQQLRSRVDELEKQGTTASGGAKRRRVAKSPGPSDCDAVVSRMAAAVQPASTRCASTMTDASADDLTAAAKLTTENAWLRSALAMEQATARALRAEVFVLQCAIETRTNKE